MKRYLILLNIAFLFSISSKAQLFEKSQPFSFAYSLKKTVPFEVIKAPVVKYFETNNSKKLKFAVKIDTDISVKQKDFIYKKTNKETVWKFGITSKKALSLNLTFSNFKLQKGQKLHIYSADRKTVLGAFTYKNNKNSKLLPIIPINSDSIIVELYCLNSSITSNELKISSIGYGFIDIFNENSNLKSGSCNIDINCDEGLPWYVEKRAVAKIIMNNGELCSGTLINNTKNNEKPYLLTANHCISSEATANNSVYIFNYEHSDCNSSKVRDFQSIAGSTLRATPSDGKLDFALVELSSAIPNNVLPYYAGWNTSTTPATTAVSIHHPNGDMKKISITNKALITSSFSGYISNSHWKVISWDLGTTEGGSSGGALFNENHQIIGDLTGGTASCDNPDEPDFFAKLSYSWDYYTESNQQLKAWLNPDNLSVTELNGYEPFPLSSGNDAGILEILSPKGNYCNGNKINPSLKIINKGLNPLTSLKIIYSINNIRLDSIDWTGNLKPYESELIVFDEMTQPIGSYSLNFILENPNSSNDENSSDNEAITDFEVIDGLQFELILTTDNYGSETTWEVTDDSNNTVYSGGPYLDDINKTFNYDFCLSPEACYQFIIHDASKDGICCSFGKGSFELLNPTSESVFTGGEFKGIDTFSFCATLKIKEKTNGPSVSIYPNPFVDNLNLAINNLDNLEFKIYTLTGSCIKEGTIQNNQITTDFLEIGVYILEISDNENFKTSYRILKQ